MSTTQKMFIYKVLNPKGQFLGMGDDKEGMTRFIKDNIMILNDHATYSVHTGMRTEEGAKLIKVQTPEDFIRS